MLHRAVASTAATWSHPDVREVHVFFTSSSRAAIERVMSLLALAWNVPFQTVQIYSCVCEPELIARGTPGTGDARLLELRSSSYTPIYARPDDTLMFVSQHTLQRLVAAQALVAWHTAGAPA
jgi:hypothetical protein